MLFVGGPCKGPHPQGSRGTKSRSPVSKTAARSFKRVRGESSGLRGVAVPHRVEDELHAINLKRSMPEAEYCTPSASRGHSAGGREDRTADGLVVREEPRPFGLTCVWLRAVLLVVRAFGGNNRYLCPPASPHPEAAAVGRLRKAATRRAWEAPDCIA